MTASDRIYEKMRESITQGTLAGGTVLSQIDLAAQFGVSRVPVREALRRLQAEHLLVARPFQRYVVHTPSSSQVLDLLDVREMLEQLALRRLVADPVGRVPTIATARAISRDMTPGDTYEDWMRRDRELHRVLNGAGSEIARIVDEARERIQQYLGTNVISRRNQIRACAEHRALLDGIENDDEATIMAIHAHHVEVARAAIEHRLREHAAALARDVPLAPVPPPA